MFRLIVLTVCAVLFAQIAYAQQCGRFDNVNPPMRYLGKYIGKLEVEIVPQNKVGEACRPYFEADKFAKPLTSDQYRCMLGCSVRRAFSCKIIMMDKPFLGITPEQVYDHELAHCRGWGADHHH